MSYKTINDFFPNIENGGVFSYLSTVLNIPWKDEAYKELFNGITDEELDLLYMIHSGDKIVPNVIQTEQMFRLLLKAAARKNLVAWNQFAKTFILEYNPIENYSMVEKGKDIRTSRSEYNETGEDTNTSTGNNTQTHNMSVGTSGNNVQTNDLNVATTDNGTQTNDLHTTSTGTVTNDDTLEHVHEIKGGYKDTTVKNFDDVHTVSGKTTEENIHTEVPTTKVHDGLTGITQFGGNSITQPDFSLKSTGSGSTSNVTQALDEFTDLSTSDGGKLGNAFYPEHRDVDRSSFVKVTDIKTVDEPDEITDSHKENATNNYAEREYNNYSEIDSDSKNTTTTNNLAGSDTGTIKNDKTGSQKTTGTVSYESTSNQSTTGTVKDETKASSTLNTSKSGNNTGNDDLDHQLTRSGNIGITSSQQMLASEEDIIRDRSKYFDMVFEALDKEITIPIWA